MKRSKPTTLMAKALCAVLAAAPVAAGAEDIDIFTGASAGAGVNPRILIVLDNTSNWARHSQKWPGGIQQGQSEANAIKTVLSSLSSSVNLGLMEFVTGGNANDDGGFIRFAVKPMSDANKTSFSTQLDTIYNNVTDPTEKRNANTPYGNLMYDVYNYYAGTNGVSPAATLAAKADSAGYTSLYTTFAPPIDSTSSCGKNFLIFIGNPNSNGPSSDSAANTAALDGLGGVTTQLGLPDLTTRNVTTSTQVGVTSACYADATAAAAGLTEFSAQCDAYSELCSIGSATANTSPIACADGQLSYSVVQSTYHPETTSSVTAVGSPVVTTGSTTAVYASAAAVDASTDHGTLSCPASTVVGNVATSYACTYAVGAAIPDPGAINTSGTTTGYYASAAAVDPTSDHGTLSCPSGYNCAYTTGAAVGTSSTTNTSGVTTSYYTSAGAVNATTDHGTLTCPANSTCSYSVGSATASTGTGTPVTTTGTTTASYASQAAVNPTTDHGTLSCPAGSTCTYSTGNAVTATVASSANTTTCYRDVTGGTGATYWDNSGDKAGLTCPAGYTCTYAGAFGTSSGCSGTGSNIMKVRVTQTAVPNTSQYSVTQTATPITYKFNVTQSAVSKLQYTVTQAATQNGQQYTVTQSATPTTVTTTVTAAYTSTSTLGYTSQCYGSAPASTTDYAASCTGTNISCSYGNAPTSATLAACPSGTSAYTVMGNDIALTTVAGTTTSTDTGPRNADEWARFLHDKGVPVAGSTTTNPNVTTYTIDVYNAQPNAEHTSLLMSMARAGGGKYFAATNEQAIVDALKQIMVEIQAVNSSFASTSLPVNATNRSQNENQVFIGMFRPDPDAKPRWFGNLKRYQLIQSGSSIELGDSVGNLAVNTLTGFITPCAKSYWTTDSGTYWNGLGINPDPAGTCASSSYNAYSDAPDGPFVEKGATAQMLRQKDMAARNVYTVSGGALTTFDSTSAASITTGGTTTVANLVKYIRGEDVLDEKGTGSLTTSRPSIHGDVIHSRPLPINYGGSTGVTVYYGANDGTFRAVNANTGNERWALVAPEFYTRLHRLMDNSPLVAYPNLAAGITPTPTAKDYFFDGSTGVYQNSDSTVVWVYPTMRRGGRMVYGLNVSSPDAPSYKWSVGCPNLTNDVGCTAGFDGIGQTWSTPALAFIKGYSTTTPVAIFGGGYDSCEDTNSASLDLTCASTKGGHIYIVNADTGALLRTFDTTRAVAGDVALIDIDNDGYPDYAYAADTGGAIWRVDFIDSPVTKVALASADWSGHKVAYTTGTGRKFLFAPAVLAIQSKAYVAIGSGDREHPLQTQYPYENVLYNRFYVYKDDLSSTSASAAVNLDSALEDYSAGSTCATAQVTPSSALKGWYMNLAKGEQTVTSALIASGMVTFSTNQPIAADSGTCANSLGVARGYWVNLLNGSGAIDADGTCGGSRSATFVGGGLPPSPVMASSVPIGSNAVTVVIGAIQKAGGASVAISPQKVRPAITSKRRKAYSYVPND